MKTMITCAPLCNLRNQNIQNIKKLFSVTLFNPGEIHFVSPYMCSQYYKDVLTALLSNELWSVSLCGDAHEACFSLIRVCIFTITYRMVHHGRSDLRQGQIADRG